MNLFLASIRPVERSAMVAGAAGLIVCVVAAFFARASVLQAYWFAWIFWSGLGFGSLLLVFLRFLARGAWGDAIMQPAEAGLMTLPLMLLLLAPALLGMHQIFPWTRADFFSVHHWPHKRAWLQGGWFAVRAVAYFGVLFAIAYFIRAQSQRAEVNPRAASALRGVSGLGAVVYFICMVFASTDWVLSLEPEWYSTMFVVIFAATQFLSALALVIVVVTSLGVSPAGTELLTSKQLHDLGNLLLAFVIFWAYVSFSQFMLIWMGNLPREISWYLHRRAGGWPGFAMTLALLQFALPFALLLLRVTKRHRLLLRPIAGLVLLASVLNVYWLTIPSWHPEGLHFPWLEIAAFCGIGGLWLATYLFFLHRRHLLVLAPAKEVVHV